VEIGHLIDTLKHLLPHKEWKKFTIQYAGELNWRDIIYVPYAQPTPVYPWYVTSDAETTTKTYSSSQLNPGIYNVETTELTT